MKDLHFSRYPCRRRMQVFHGIIWRAVYQQLRIKRKKLPSMMSILFWSASFEIDSRQPWCVLLDAKLFEEMTTCFVFPTVFKAAVDADYSIFTHCYSPSESVFLYMRVESDVVFFFRLVSTFGITHQQQQQFEQMWRHVFFLIASRIQII